MAFSKREVDKSTEGFVEKVDISKEDKDKFAYKNPEKLLGLFK